MARGLHSNVGGTGCHKLTHGKGDRYGGIDSTIDSKRIGNGSMELQNIGGSTLGTNCAKGNRQS